MFRINDVIVYGTQGVCRIAGVEEKSVDGKKKQYFVLQPVSEKGATIFVPTDNALVLQKMRRLLTKEEIHQLIDSAAEESPVWVVNENERKERYKSILGKGDHRELIQMHRAIHDHKIAREAEGKRLHMSDEKFMKDAEQLLYSEFRYVLELEDRETLIAYIAKRRDQSMA